ncbi:LysR family transcriptional regulator [Alkalihalobacillus deserti]|uniref:LysR family transcriptional regulator n=1 Tax=Alkalihalobacillus deserti TaxID=2879466 RepID=UPI001D13429D|nr:LysR family transcriptional regulator [Alkalihalobacillus deserti]
MELRHIKYFIAVAEELHFGRAATRLNISQPPLSRQISQFEDEIGVKLFFRTKQKVELTDAGKELLKQSYEILKMVDKACKDVRNISQGLKGSLLISYASGMNEVLIQIVLLFQEEFPNVKIVLQQSLSSTIIEDLRERSIDIGVMPYFDCEFLQFQTVTESPYGVILPKTHRLAERTSPIAVRELAEVPFIATTKTSIYFSHIMSICNQAGFHPKISQEALGLPTIISLVAAGMGVALISRLSYEKHTNPNIVFKEISPVTNLQTSCAWHKDEKSPAVNTFLTFTQNYLKNNNVLVKK